MKPLTIEELKQLKMGDWVWLIDCGYGIYAKIVGYEENYFILDTLPMILDYRILDYGKTWVAYKNKEQAECDNSYDLLKVKYEIVLKEYAKLKRKATKYNFMTKTIDKEITKQAEQKLIELRGME